MPQPTEEVCSQIWGSAALPQSVDGRMVDVEIVFLVGSCLDSIDLQARIGQSGIFSDVTIA